MKKTNKKSSKQHARRLKKNAKRLAAYSAAAAATVATTGTANAAEVFHEIPDTPVSGDGILFNMVDGAVTPAPAYPGFLSYSTQGVFRIGQYYFPSFPGIYGPAGDTEAGFVGPGGFVASYFYPDVLSVSERIGNRKPFGAATYYNASYGNDGWLSNFPTDAGRYVGLKFSLGTDVHFGWARLSGAGEDMTLDAFGYNDAAGVPSHITPEPSSMALLAMGAAGLGTWRRRKPAA
jgi:hypothetical protein